MLLLTAPLAVRFWVPQRRDCPLTSFPWYIERDTSREASKSFPISTGRCQG